jgi:hypothetical protein
MAQEMTKYRYKWMTECRYSASLVDAGAESNGYSQARDWEGSSPYYRDCGMPHLHVSS